MFSLVVSWFQHHGYLLIFQFFFQFQSLLGIPRSRWIEEDAGAKTFSPFNAEGPPGQSADVLIHLPKNGIKTFFISQLGGRILGGKMPLTNWGVPRGWILRPTDWLPTFVANYTHQGWCPSGIIPTVVMDYTCPLFDWFMPITLIPPNLPPR